MKDVEQQLRQFIVDNFLFGENSTPLAHNDSLLDKRVIDSTGVRELVAFLQEKFAITIADEEIVPHNLDSILGISAFVQKKLSAQA